MQSEWRNLQPVIADKIKALKEELRTRQNPDGSFPSDTHPENPDITAMATLSFYLTEGSTDLVKRSTDYLVSLFHDGRACKNPWLGDVEDPKMTAVVVRHLRKIDAGIPEIETGIKYIEDHIDEHGRPVLPHVYRAQNPFAAASDIVKALPSFSDKHILVRTYILSQQRSDGSFDVPVSWSDPSYKLVQLSGATRMENTSGVVLTFVEDLGYFIAHPQIRAAVDYITPRTYPPLQVPLLTERLLRRLPSPALQVVGATLVGNPQMELDELPRHKYQTVAEVLHHDPIGINQRVHVLRQLIRLQTELYKRLQ